MYNNYKVKVFIFAGRQATMELLMSQLVSPIIDEIILAKNTFNESDLRYLDSLQKTNEKVRCLELPYNIKQDRHNAWKWLYQYMEDEDTIYFKIDDDVIFIEPGYFEKTCKFKVEHPEYICVFPFIINNPFCNTLRPGTPLYKSNDSMFDKMYAGFYSADVAEMLHQEFIRFPYPERYRIPNRELSRNDVYFKDPRHPHTITWICPWYEAERIAINAICFFGAEFKALKVKDRIKECYSDELWLTYNLFDYTSKKHCIYGDTLVSHFAFSGQTGLRERQRRILPQYIPVIRKFYA